MTNRLPSSPALRRTRDPIRLRPLVRIRTRARAEGRAWYAGRIAAWAEGVAARYGQGFRPGAATDMVLPAEHPGGITVANTLTRHLHLAQRWAPRLHLTVVTMGRSGPGGSSAGADATHVPGIAPATWAPARAPLAAKPVEQTARVQRALAPVTEAGAQELVRRFAARVEPVHAVSTGPAPAGTASVALSSGTAAPVMLPAAPPVPRVFPRPQAPQVPEGGRDLRQLAPATGWDAPPAPPRAGAAPSLPVEASPAALEQISERVMQQISRRIQAHRERTGRA